VIQENSTQSCNEWVKLCIDSAACDPQTFQIHSVGAYKRDSGSKSMETLESEFTQALGGMAKYDPFMELHTAFYTSDLDSYITSFKSDSVSYFPSTFTENGKTYHCITVQVDGSLKANTGSLLLLTIIGDSSSLLAAEPYLHHHGTPRASATALQRAELLHSNMTSSSLGLSPRCLAGVNSVCSATSADCSACIYKNWGTISKSCPYATEAIVAASACSAPSPSPPSPTPPSPVPRAALTPLHISWPTANIDAMVKYFENTLSGTKVSQTSANGTTTYYGKLFSSDTVEMRWEQSSKATQGPTTVAEWEAYTAALHKKCIPSPNTKNQGFDRLADQHIGGRNPGGESLDTYIVAQQKSGYSYRLYSAPQGSPNFLYLYGPNGWGYQITGSCYSQCGSNVVFYNECTQGTTGHCSTDL